MTYATKAAVLITALAAILIFGWAHRAESDDPITTDPQPTATTTEAILTTPVVPGGEIPKDQKERALEAYLDVQQNGTDDPEEWLLALEWCESNETVDAINPVDRDGTASYGLLQFKPDTFYSFAEAYGITVPASTADLPAYMDPDTQRAIVRAMMRDPSVDWSWQFPDCVQRHIGKPPEVLE